MNAVEVRLNDDGSIDEIVAKGCTLHIEQLSDSEWYMGIDASDGSHWQFFAYAKRGAVLMRHYETIPAEKPA